MKFDKFTDVCMTGSIRHAPSHTNVCKFFIFSTYIFSADITPDMLELCRVLFLVLVYVFNLNLFEFSAAILEKGLLFYAGKLIVSFAAVVWARHTTRPNDGYEGD